ncbi:hypothetical protein [Azospirillum palustre]
MGDGNTIAGLCSFIADMPQFDAGIQSQRIQGFRHQPHQFVLHRRNTLEAVHILTKVVPGEIQPGFQVGIADEAIGRLETRAQLLHGLAGHRFAAGIAAQCELTHGTTHGQNFHLDVGSHVHDRDAVIVSLELMGDVAERQIASSRQSNHDQQHDTEADCDLPSNPDVRQHPARNVRTCEPGHFIPHAPAVVTQAGLHQICHFGAAKPVLKSYYLKRGDSQS